MVIYTCTAVGIGIMIIAVSVLHVVAKGTAMIKKKICMLGAFSVGKTSLVRQFITSMFSDAYLTTVGVRVNRKDMAVDGRDVSLLLWDISGEDSVQELRLSYLRGSAGYILVVDGTRAATLTTAVKLQQRVKEELGELPFVCLVNKHDLAGDWQVEENDFAELQQKGWSVVKASAKTGQGVSAAFLDIARRCTKD